MADGLPQSNRLLADVVERGAQLGGHRKALAWSGGSRSYHQLRERITCLASVLVSRDVGVGTRVAVLSPNSPELLELVLAASLIGAVVVPINTRLSASEVGFVVTDAGVTHALIDPSLTALARESGLLGCQHWFIGSGLDNVIASNPGNPELGRPSAALPLIQMYTSGTSGQPKGCLLTQHNVLATAANVVWGGALRPEDRYVLWPPMIHRGGFDIACGVLLAGGAVVIGRSPDAEEIWSLVEEHAATALSWMPRDLGIFTHPAAQRFGARIERTVHGASFDGPEMFELFRAVMPNARYAGSYGLTEAGVLVTAAIGDAERDRRGTIGRAGLNCDLAVLDDRGAACEVGGVGEICVRGPTTMLGYHHLPTETAEALRGGWLHTGDLGRFDQDGYLFIEGRLKDMIKTGYENVYGVEVENILNQHPDVAEAIVFGVPDERWGEAVKAVIVAVPGTDPRPEILDAFCIERLSRYKRPRWYEFADDEAIVRTTFRKPSKTVLRARHDPATSVRVPERS